LSDFQPAARLRGIEKSLIRQVFDRAREGSINLGLGEPDLPTPEVIRHAATRAILEEQNGYTTHAGLPALRERVASDYPYLERTPERVIITAGSQEALYLALMTLVDEGDEVLLPDPGFVAYPTIARMAGGTARFYRMPAAQGFSFDAEEFRRALTPRTKVVVCISPSNPTGRTLSLEDLRAMSAALEGTNAYVISDEIYRELYYTPERPASISDFYPRTLVIGGLSKSMSMTGWRVGWLCGDDEVLRSALILHGYVTTCASTVSQKAALAAWTPDAEKAREGFRERFSLRRDYLLARVERELSLRAVVPDGAFYTMVRIGEGLGSMLVAEEMLEHGVITVPGVAFGKEGESWLRVSFCADEDKLALGVDRMKKALESFSEKWREQR
jgi:aspartate aminotransferase